jgi:hypothetical protein
MQVDRAQRAHNCQHNAAHRIQSGDKRLKVPKERSHEHYCVACAKSFIANGIARLEDLRREIEDQGT